ncbi:hypothetical protein [Caballeronia telluris]|nr:hypothetical protein [Caballeronia telluris]
MTYAHFLRCGAPSDVSGKRLNKVCLFFDQVIDSKELTRCLPEMWARMQKHPACLFFELSTEVLNKVIHRPVESRDFSKIILNLAPIVMFHFKYGAQSLVLSSAYLGGGPCGRRET